jgi:hypothetical protein
MSITMRLPNNRSTQMQFLFVDDSGAEMALVYDQDLAILQNTPQGTVSQRPPLLGATRITGSQGGRGSVQAVRAIEVSMLADTTGEFMTLWDWIPVAVHEVIPKRTPPPRLNSPWHRYKLYTGSAPDGSGRTWAFNRKNGWNTLVPRVADARNAPRVVGERGGGR